MCGAGCRGAGGAGKATLGGSFARNGLVDGRAALNRKAVLLANRRKGCSANPGGLAGKRRGACGGVRGRERWAKFACGDGRGACAQGGGVLGGKRMEVAADGAPAEVGARGFVARVGGKSVADRVRSHKGIAAKAAPTGARGKRGDGGPSTGSGRTGSGERRGEGRALGDCGKVGGARGGEAG